MSVADEINYKTRWIIRKYHSQRDYDARDEYEVKHVDKNILLNGGIATFLDLLGGLGTPVAFDNANARLAVGDSTAASVATQTALQAATNVAFAGMASGYPQRAGQVISWRAVFDGNAANFPWQEFGVDNGAAAGVLLNRRVSNQGTKASGQVWTLDLQITLS